MAKRVGVDKWLFGVTVLLVFIGLLMVFSASAVMAQDRYGSPYTFVRSQAVAAVLGLMAMIVVMRIDYRRFNRPIVVFPAVAITTLCCCWASFSCTIRTTPIAGSASRGSSPCSRRRLPSPCWCFFSPGFCRISCNPFATGATPCCRRLCPAWSLLVLILEGA